MRVRDWMTVHPTSITPETTVLGARTLLRREGFHHLPVVQGGWLAGMVTDRDLARADDSAVVRSVMSAPVCTAERDDDVRSVVRLLVKHRIHGMPVLSEDGFLIGMITTTDCLRALHQSRLLASEPALPRSKYPSG